MNYYNTNRIIGKALKWERQNAETQGEIILRFFEHYPHRSFTPFEVQEEIRILQGKEWPITSVRRAMTDLTNSNKLTKINIMKRGRYGKPNHIWKLTH